MEVTVEVLSREDIENIMVGALEGGSNYWYFLDDDGCQAIRNVVTRDDDPYLSTSITKAVMDHGASIPIRDNEDPDVILGHLTKDSIKKGIVKALDDDSYAIKNIMNDRDDAYDADVMFQYFLLGEIVYG